MGKFHGNLVPADRDWAVDGYALYLYPGEFFIDVIRHDNLLFVNFIFIIDGVELQVNVLNRGVKKLAIFFHSCYALFLCWKTQQQSAQEGKR
jgi:hypothetical protein